MEEHRYWKQKNIGSDFIMSVLRDKMLRGILQKYGRGVKCGSVSVYSSVEVMIQEGLSSHRNNEETEVKSLIDRTPRLIILASLL